MANHFRLYERPLTVDTTLPALAITGELEGYIAEDSYESRLQIVNSVGRCTVEIVEANLPPGAGVRVDNLTKEVVLKWAAYQVVDAVLSGVPNGGFEDGDDGTWIPGGGSNGAGWSIGTGPDYATKDGVYSARFADIKTQGSDLVLPLIPAKVNDFIKLTAQVNQGASSKNNAGARASLMYLDANQNQVLRVNGNLVSSASGGAWHESAAEANAPAGTAWVMVILSAFRKKQNKALWVDSVQWNHKYVLGQDTDETYFLHIKVTDSLNRVAYWQGDIEEFLEPLTGQLMPVFLYDSVGIASGPIGFRTLGKQEVLDSSVISMIPLGINIVEFGRELVDASPESISIAGSVTDIVIREVARRVNAEPESTTITGAVLSILYKQHIAPAARVEPCAITATILGITYG